MTKKVEIAEARVVSASAYSRMKSVLRASGIAVVSAFSRVDIRRLLRVLKLVIPVVAGAIIVFLGITAKVKSDIKKEQQRKADCKRYNQVRIENIKRLQFLYLTSDKQAVTKYRVFAQSPGSPYIDSHDNGCHPRFIVDVPADKSAWAWQTSAWRSNSCVCWIEYHIRSIEKDVY